ncbi:Protein of unknown function [Pyronema omphalodes CBS 100304]|uniref:Uncharacterized protein n=1 Tax=Pyronema omphalodes (strain CBS 100304) TaxID=1076935 RepID=U4LSK2_PYROM|nr:Protein of unknown function [Pyronema omphalodes CBS 100304]
MTSVLRLLRKRRPASRVRARSYHPTYSTAFPAILSRIVVHQRLGITTLHTQCKYFPQDTIVSISTKVTIPHIFGRGVAARNLPAAEPQTPQAFWAPRGRGFSEG